MRNCGSCKFLEWSCNHTWCGVKHTSKGYKMKISAPGKYHALFETPQEHPACSFWKLNLEPCEMMEMSRFEVYDEKILG